MPEAKVFAFKCPHCGEINVLDRKPVDKIEVNCHNCGETMTVDPRKPAQLPVAEAAPEASK